MPELPELQVMINNLKKELLHSYIDHVAIADRSLKSDIKDAEQQKIIEIMRHGRKILFQLSHDSIIFPLSKKGYFMLTEEKRVEKDTRLILDTDRGKLHIVDKDMKEPILFVDKDETELSPLGVDPLTKQFNLKYLYKKLKSARVPLKFFLTDQTIVAGIGNVYAAKILKESKLSSARRSDTLSKRQIRILFWNIKTILRQAIGLKDHEYASADPLDD